MKGIIIYKSNYGSTKQYANWLGEETGYEAIDIDRTGESTITENEIIILGSPIFAGKPLIAGWIKKKWRFLSDKEIVLYTTSGAAPDNPVMQKVMENSFGPKMAGKIQYFPLGGRITFAKLTPLHRFFMRLGSKNDRIIESQSLQVDVITGGAHESNGIRW